MMRFKFHFLTVCVLLAGTAAETFSQKNQRIIACKPKAFAALKPLPELKYGCPEEGSESDDLILKLPGRKSAINATLRNLESFTSPAWWQTAVNDLNICDLRGKPGALTGEEKERFTDPEYQVKLMGNNQLRLVLLADPCYQTYYNGANAFLLYRKGAKVYATEAIDGYFSRLSNSVSLKTYRLGSERIIEIETVNISGMRPETSPYYFVIDKAANKAVRGELVKKGGRLVFRRLKK